MRYVTMLLLLFSCSCSAVEDPTLKVWTEHKADLHTVVVEYINTFSSEKEYKAWLVKLAEKEETRSLETIALDWFFDNQADLEDRLPSAIRTACYFFRRFVETGTPPPVKLRERITADGLSGLRDYLKGCVEVVRDK